MKKLFGLLIVLSVFGADLLLNPTSAWGNAVPATPPTPPTPPVIEECNVDGNLISNYNFNCGEDNWNFHSSINGNNFNVAEVEGADGNVAIVNIKNLSDNIQLFQKDIHLDPSTEYELSFRAKANRDRKLPIYLQKHTSPNMNYGISGHKAELTETWTDYSIVFTSTGFSDPVEDGRLRFWFSNFSKSGDKVWIDDVVLRAI